MDGPSSERNRRETLGYRVEIEGRLSSQRIQWLGAEARPSDGNNTVLTLRVADQADLHGRLRRLHDLNVRLVSVQRVDVVDADDGPATINDNDEE